MLGRFLKALLILLAMLTPLLCNLGSEVFSFVFLEAVFASGSIASRELRGGKLFLAILALDQFVIHYQINPPSADA